MRSRAPSETFLRDAEAAKAVRDRLSFLLGYGALARGPWMISMGESAIDFRLGHRCERNPRDACHREAIIGCGIGLAELKLALRQLGCVESTILLPEDSEPDLLARIYIDKVERNAEPDLFVLSQAMSAPASSRTPHTIDPRFHEELAAHASAERAILSFAYELPLAGPGAPCGAPTLASVARQVTWLESRSAAPGEPVDDRGRGELSFEWSVGAVIATRGNGIGDWLCAGQALARVALRARVEGLFTRVEGAANNAMVEGAHAQVALHVGVPSVQGEPAHPAQPVGPFFGGPRGRS
jgi:hypothetical protein